MGMADMQKLTQVETTEGAFAALTDGKVVTWGSAVLGGDSSTVQEELVDIQDLVHTRCLCRQACRWKNYYLGRCKSRR